MILTLNIHLLSLFYKTYKRTIKMKTKEYLYNMFMEHDKDFLSRKIDNESAYKAWNEQIDVAKKITILAGVFAISSFFAGIYLLVKVLA